mgnify:CR=1 FL=1
MAVRNWILYVLDDEDFQTKMDELEKYFDELRSEILLVREKGYENTEIIEKSEKFQICDEAVGFAEVYSQKKATGLDHLEKSYWLIFWDWYWSLLRNW